MSGGARQPYIRRGMGSCAVRLLRRREMTVQQLHEQVQANFPNDVVPIETLVYSLVDRKLAVRDGYLIGLTAHGAKVAEIADESPRAPVLARREAPASLVEDVRAAIVVDRPDHVLLLTRSPARLAASAADLAPAPMRRGADAALKLPSRFGNRLHYRDGRITDLAGNPIA